MSNVNDAKEAMAILADTVANYRRVLKLLKAENNRHLSPAGKALAEYAAASGFTHRQIADMIGTSRPGISNYLRRAVK